MKKTLAILLVLAMSLALLTACGSSSTPKATQSTAATEAPAP